MGKIKMNIILLSGGSGKRLWPLSNDTRSKQFLKLLKNDQGDFESMVQRVYRQIQKANIEANIVVATGLSQVDSIKNQLGNKIDIIIEPERRDTFPAIALSCVYLALEKKVDLDEVVVVLPVDPYTDIEYFKTLPYMENAVKNGVADLVLMGIKPTYPSTKYGYIVPAKGEITCLSQDKGINSKEIMIHRVERFIEKPTQEIAEQLILDDAVWNGGVFAFKLRYLMEIVKKYIDSTDINPITFCEIQSNYHIFKKTSFDYEVVEQVASIAMIPYDGCWKDLGTWNTLTEEMEEGCMGRVMVGEDSINTSVINELSIPIVALGVKDLVVVASPDGILISDKQKSSYLKSYVDSMNDRPMYEESQWGDYKALDYIQYTDGIKSLTKHLTIKAGQYLNYLSHHIRDEIWTIVDGTGEIVIDGLLKKVSRGDVVYIARGQRHTIKAYTNGDIHCIEVQIGSELVENDIEKFEWQW
ncbi:MAG: mannose-phosphate guanylyltransferase [Herbinix sp.]|jgi:mannose-1-phosphate guanylyltransferase|nr:mannose-phosphate guanylyltransferase [Herbinix sp.]